MKVEVFFEVSEGVFVYYREHIVFMVFYKEAYRVSAAKVEVSLCKVERIKVF